MSAQLWFETLRMTNKKYISIQRANRTWLVRDDIKLLHILSCHHILSKENYAYQLCTIKSMKPDPGQTKCWVPLIPGYCIISKIGSHFLQLSINGNNENLEFKWVDYGNDSTFTGDPIAGDVDYMFFESLRKYI